MTATQVRPLTESEQRYVELDRLWRFHQSIVEAAVYCYHKDPWRDGQRACCPRCKSIRVRTECEAELNTLGQEVAA